MVTRAADKFMEIRMRNPSPRCVEVVKSSSNKEGIVVSVDVELQLGWSQAMLPRWKQAASVVTSI